MSRRKILYNTEIFTKKNALSYYLLGVFCTDGCIKQRCESIWTASLTSKDKSWLYNIAQLISPQLKLNKSKHSRAYFININNANICSWLMANNCEPRKTLTLKFPDIPEEYIPDFIRGCIDGDGSIGQYQGKRDKKYKMSVITLVSASKLFAEKMQKTLQNKGIECQLRQSNPDKRKKLSSIKGRIIIPRHILYCLRITNKNALKLINYIYYSNDVFCLKRKQRKALQIINYFNKHKFKRILPVPDKEVLEMWIATKSIRQIGREFGITQKVVYRWMKIHNIPKRGRLKNN